jgi:hypothetical protein
VSIGDWEHCTEKGFENAWSGETFPLRRVSFPFWISLPLFFAHRLRSTRVHRSSNSNSSARRTYTLDLQWQALPKHNI